MKMTKDNWSFLLFPILLLTLLTCCVKKTQPDSGAPSIIPRVYDFPQIVQKGEINVLTLSGSMSYFIYKGEAKGYEYELLSNFAESFQLKINIHLAENETKLMEMLLRGEGDLIAYNIPITNEGKKQVLYCGNEVINEQVLIQQNNKSDTFLSDVTGLIGKEVWVIRNSKYYNRLNNLNDELGGGIHVRTIEKDTITVEDLIEMVSDGEIFYTISDADMAKLNKTYFNNINTSLLVGHPQRSSWAVRKNNPILAKAINRWFADNRNAPQIKQILKRYFEMSKMPPIEEKPVHTIGPHQISPFDIYFKEYARQTNCDWRLLASISYQESGFHTDRVSWAGAAGLMGLMPTTAQELGLPINEIYDPEKNIKAGANYLKKLNRIFSYIQNEDERIRLVVASYNSGPGHVFDAQALAEKFGKNPQEWVDVEEYLKLKNLPEYYDDPVCKFGYLRSTETINYVRSVIERWHYYRERVSD